MDDVTKKRTFVRSPIEQYHLEKRRSAIRKKNFETISYENKKELLSQAKSLSTRNLNRNIFP